MSESEAGDLEQLVGSPGWQRVVRFVREEWDSGLETHLGQAANDRDDLMALQKLRQVLAAKRAVERMIAWPTERLATLQRETQAAHERESDRHPSRRGSL